MAAFDQTGNGKAYAANYQKRYVQTRKCPQPYPGNISEKRSALQTPYLGDSCFSTLSLWNLFKEEYVLIIVEKNPCIASLFLSHVQMAQPVALAVHGETIDIYFPGQHTRESEIPSPGTSRR